MDLMTESVTSTGRRRADTSALVGNQAWDREPGPVRYDHDAESWVVSQYETAREVLLGSGWSSDPMASTVTRRDLNAVGLDDTPLGGTMLSLDPPDHRRVRGSVRDVFTPRYIGAMGAGIDAIASEIIGAVPSGEPFDLVSDIAAPLPVAVIAEWMDIEPSVAQLMWDESGELVGDLDAVVLPTELIRPSYGLTRLLTEFLRLASERRTNPGEDLLSLLATDPALELDEVVANAILLCIAGHETTAKVLGSAVVRLCWDQPGQGRLIDRLDDVGSDDVIDELLRLDGTAQVVVRTATVPQDVDGCSIGVGERVFVAIAAANRDPGVFERPHEFRLDRERRRPHLALGHGVHRCLGGALARLELKIALRRIAIREPRLAGPVSWHPSAILRGPARVPVQFGSGEGR